MTYLELLRPLEKAQETFVHLGNRDIVSAGSSYLESIPGMLVLSKAIPVIASKALNPSVAPTAIKASKAIFNWYLQPLQGAKHVASLTGKGAVKMGTKVAASKAALSVPIVAGALALQHAGSRVLRNRLSLVDAVMILSTGRATPYQHEMLTKKHKWFDWIIGDPLTTLVIKKTGAGRSAIEGGTQNGV
jgi:hypothetical protein